MAGRERVRDMPPADVVAGWHARAATAPARIVLADLGDPRADTAAARLAAEGLAVPIHPVLDRSVGAVADAAAHAEARGLDPDDPVVAAAVLVRAGEADAAVAGATRPSADVLRAGLRVLGTAPGTDLVSSCFMLVMPDGRPVAFGDCGVVPDPDADQMASIAIDAARDHIAAQMNTFDSW